MVSLTHKEVSGALLSTFFGENVTNGSYKHKVDSMKQNHHLQGHSARQNVTPSADIEGFGSDVGGCELFKKVRSLRIVSKIPPKWWTLSKCCELLVECWKKSKKKLPYRRRMSWKTHFWCAFLHTTPANAFVHSILLGTSLKNEQFLKTWNSEFEQVCVVRVWSVGCGTAGLTQSVQPLLDLTKDRDGAFCVFGKGYPVTTQANQSWNPNKSTSQVTTLSFVFSVRTNL